MLKPTLIPLPEKVSWKNGAFVLGPSARVVVASAGAQPAAELLAKYLRPATGYKLPVIGGKASGGDIVVKEHGKNAADAAGFRDESYALTVGVEKVELDAPCVDGLLRGVQTLRQLFPAEIYREKTVRNIVWEAPAAAINDRPAYRWRGMHFDVSRHFFTVKEVKRYVELIAQHKYNILHWHLTDDQGWRIEIKKYPKLTKIGSRRAQTVIGKQYQPPVRHYDGKPYGGFYTQKDIKEIVAFAAERGVTIVPEIDMPGHMQAAVAAYPELGNNPRAQLEVRPHWGISQHILNPAPATIKFMENVLGEVMALFPGKFIHIGGDEALKDEWKDSVYAQERMAELGCKNVEELQSWFVSTIGKFVMSKGRSYIGWDEIMEGGIPVGAGIVCWRNFQEGNSPLVNAARAGRFAIAAHCAYTYFDYCQGDPEKEPIHIGGDLPCEKVYRFRVTPKELTAQQRKFVLGGQGHVWTEYIGDFAYVEYMAFPRACALAEKLWSPEDADTFRGFADRLAAHRARLAAQGVNAHPLP